MNGVCAMVCHKVDRLEAELAAARTEVSDAVAASHRASARREEAEERRRRLNDSNLELVREVPHDMHCCGGSIVCCLKPGSFALAYPYVGGRTLPREPGVT